MSAHTCWPSFFDMNQRAKCGEVIKVGDSWTKCGRPLVRIMHGPGHRIDGHPCGFPDGWSYCWITAELAATQTADLLTLPRWKVV